MSVAISLVKKITNFLITLILWIYFTVGSLIFFFPHIIYYYARNRNLESALQIVSHRIMKVFFYILKILCPGIKMDIPGEVESITSSIIVSNHISYLDPLLMISLFERHKTIVKGSFFKVPVFGWLLKSAGFLPYYRQGTYDNKYIEDVQNLEKFFSDGGNLFLFPEGTRSKDGNINKLKKGAFNIARRCNAPIKVLQIKNTNAIFKPGRFLLNICDPNTIQIKIIGKVRPDYDSDKFSLKNLTKQIENIYLNNYS